MSRSGISSLFYIHGKLCSYHPVEVLLVCITGAVCLLTLNIYDATHHFTSQQNEASGEKVSCSDFASYTNVNVALIVLFYIIIVVSLCYF